jgi:hypothetical protein
MILKERIGTEVGLMTGRVKQSFRNGKASLSDLQTSVSETTRRAVRKTDYYVHDNAWRMMAVSAGIAFVAGFLLSKRNQEGIAAAIETGDPEIEKKVQKVNSWEFVHSTIPLALFLWKAVQASRCARKGMI